jgi:hypothetical protein
VKSNLTLIILFKLKEKYVPEIFPPGGKVNQIEASWVKTPAFAPAILHNTLKVGPNWTGKPLKSFVPEDRILEAAPERGW